MEKSRVCEERMWRRSNYAAPGVNVLKEYLVVTVVTK
jgi:hypothetical protein